MILRIPPALLALVAFLACLQSALAQSSNSSSDDSTRWIQYQTTGPSGQQETVYLKDNRKPALYTGNFGDCLGNSLVNVTRFDAAYYQDNMTVLFHLAGSSALANESLMMYIGVYAYGESRFDLLFNPCFANIDSLCPLNSSVPVSADGIIPVDQSDVSTIPSIAFSIPDFEGQAILRIFANSTQSEIGCYSAVVTNGNSFAQPKSVGTVLGVFALVTILASFATAIYGEAVPTMRLHYAHSLSAGVVIAVFQHIFFTGALSMNWPSVLVAWWSNFAWAGGMIYSQSMQQSINRFIGNNIGNTSQVGAAPSDSTQDGLGGGYDISQIYKRSSFPTPANHPLLRDMASEIYRRDYSKVLRRDVVQRQVERALTARFPSPLQKRDVLANASEGYVWYGHPVGAGMPLPGNYSGFAGTLAQEGIRASNAFMTGLLWFLILLVILVAAVVFFKWTLEGLARVRAIQQDRLKFFRDHWLRYAAAVGFRTCYLAFFMMMFLTIFEFTYQSSGGVKAVAAIFFFIFLAGTAGAAWYACYYKKHIADHGHQMERTKLLGAIPWFNVKKAGPEQPGESKSSSKPFWRRAGGQDDGMNADRADNIHDNDDYTMNFGWLASRFRRTRWWFFTVWIGYELLRAIFYAGASGYPLAQVFGLLIIEFVAFVYIVWARPFEGRRLNLIVVYCLGFSKVASVALSAAFDVQFNLARITTTVIGIVIIVIQGILTIITMIAVVVGVISSYMSLSRNHEDFRPRKWHGLREKYFDHLDRVVNDVPREAKPKRTSRSLFRSSVADEDPSGFEMKGMRRLAKIEDEDKEFASEMRPQQDPQASYISLEDNRAPSPVNGSETALAAADPRSGTATPVRISRAPSVNSMSQTALPFGARPHRPSWSTRDFMAASAVAADRGEPADRAFSPIDMNKSVADEDPVARPPSSSTPNKLITHRKTPSRSATLPTSLAAAGPSSSIAAAAAAPAEKDLKPMPSADSLRLGGDVSSRDTIGKVPAPTVRPRAGTYGSGGVGVRDSGRRSATPSFLAGGGGAEGSRSVERLSLPVDGGAGGVGEGAGSANTRTTRFGLLPAQEVDEMGRRSGEGKGEASGT